MAAEGFGGRQMPAGAFALILLRLASLILLGAMLVACARTAPAPIDYRVSAVIERVLQDDAERRAALDQRQARREIGPGPVYTVRRGDNLNAIAARYGIYPDEIARLNGIDNPNRIYPGQTLVLPAMARVQVAGAAPRRQTARPAVIVDETAIPRDVPAVAVAPEPPPQQVASLVETVPAAPAPPREPVAAVPIPAPRPDAPLRIESASRTPRPEPPRPAPAYRPSGSQFDWPVRGRVLQAFGPQGGGRINDGINIATTAGATVRAAADGEVIYVGESVKNLGNLLLIRHADGWITAYAHTDNVSVEMGQQVRQGDAIARAGGLGEAAQVHFQLRRGTQPIDPLTRLPGLTS